MFLFARNAVFSCTSGELRCVGVPYRKINASWQQITQCSDTRADTGAQRLVQHDELPPATAWNNHASKKRKPNPKLTTCLSSAAKVGENQRCRGQCCLGKGGQSTRQAAGGITLPALAPMHLRWPLPLLTPFPWLPIKGLLEENGVFHKI